MNVIEKILQVPSIWNLSQSIFGCDAQKRRLYRSVFEGRGRLLDFGCADGNVFPAFSNFEYYGIDVNTRLIEYARRKYTSFKNAHFINANILDKPFPQDFFDFVLFACTGHHLEDKNLFEITKELANTLKGGGKLYFFDTIRKPDSESFLLRFLMRLDQGKFMRDAKRYRSIIHLFSERLKPINFKTLQIKGTLMPQPTFFYAEFIKI